MADAIDLAQQREQEDRERHISNARSRIAAPSRFLCEECDAPIRKLAALRFRVWPFA